MSTILETRNFIDDDIIKADIEAGEKATKEDIKQILKDVSGGDHRILDGRSTAALLANKDPELDEAIFAAAKEIKEKIYGNRIVLFAPLYVTNKCKNQCAYCAFSANNTALHRRTLTLEEIAEETKVIEDMGHKRVLMVYGETNYEAQWLVDTINAVYETKSGENGEIRRVNINCAPLSVDDFKTLKTANIGTFQCFQETYHVPTYESVHLAGKKKDFAYRLNAQHRAVEAGIDDVAIGALFGLYDHRYEVLGMLQHSRVLEKDYNGIGPHTISFPRIEPALGSEMSENPPHIITDDVFKKIVAVTRIAVPYTGLIMSTRENPEMRRELLELGISQVSGASRVYPGAYKDSLVNKVTDQQFMVGDTREVDDIIRELAENGYIPSFCTGCYRKGRTGDHFMGLAKTEFIKNHCTPNAVLTFYEYLQHYGSDKTKQAGMKLIESELEKTKKREKLLKCLNALDSGGKDQYF